MMNRLSPILAAACAALVANLAANEIPTVLPDPDGQSGDATKPVKVYILAGQSNMVGMGNISGAKNLYSGVFFSTDPAIPEGAQSIYKVGDYKFGRCQTFLPDGTATGEAIAAGQLEVPLKGVYRAHCLSGSIEIDGKPTGEGVVLEPGKRHSFTLTGYKQDPPRFWLEKIDLLGNGDLEAVVKREGKFPWLVDDKGEWSVRNDVYFQEARLAENGTGSPLSATSNGKTIGPEQGFGHVMGTFHDEQVLLIKTAQGNRSLGYDFRPPSSGRTDPDSQFESVEYKLMIEGVRKTLANIDKVVPGYKGQGYELAGFTWFQGHKDSGTPESIAEYEGHLTNLINDVRKDLDVPKLPAVVATIGFGGHNMPEKFLKILEAQMAVSDPAKHPEFAGNVGSVDIRDFWREVDESPVSQDYHYNRNAETYLLVGDALGRAMVTLKGGKAEPLPQEPRPKQMAKTDTAEPTDEEKAAAQKALAPIMYFSIAPAYVAKHSKELQQEAAGTRPERSNQFLQGAMFGLSNIYRAAGIDRYDWKPFKPDLRDQEWQYTSFDPKETLPKEKGKRYRKVTYPEGMENWAAADFDPAQAAWKSGLPPFGQLDGHLAPLSDSCTASFCGCGTKPRTLWEKEVLLVRGTFDLPEFKEGHRYRIVVGGSAHVNAGEGFAIYINGKQLAESTDGVYSRQGGQPRGAHIYADFRDDFKGGKVTIAAKSFLRYNHPRNGLQPPRGHFSLWIEEAALPPGSNG